MSDSQPLTRDSRQTVVARASVDPAFRRALLQEAIGCDQEGDLTTARALVDDWLAAIATMDTGRAAMAVLPPFTDALIAEVSPKGRKRLRHVRTLTADLSKGVPALSLQGGMPPSETDLAAMQAATQRWIAAFERASGCKIASLMASAPWPQDPGATGEGDEVRGAVVDNLHTVVAGVLADHVLADWTDEETREVRVLFQVLPPSTTHTGRFPADTWLTRSGLYWRTPTSRAAVDAVTDALRTWLAGPGQRLFAHVCNASFTFSIARTTLPARAP